jgi:hypothetical protein
MKAKPSFWKTSLRSLHQVTSSGGHAISVLPRANSSQQGQAKSHLSLALLGSALAFSTFMTSVQAQSEPEILAEEEVLTPLYEPVFRESGMLQVSDVHSISYKVYGNPKGKPVLCVHGGPGAGTGRGKVSVCCLF